MTLKELREIKKISQQKVAVEAGLSLSAYCNLESGRAKLSDAKYQTIKKLALILGAEVYTIADTTMEDVVKMKDLLAVNGFYKKRDSVMQGESKIYEEWAKHSTITQQEFIDALEWVCSDPLNESGLMTREIALTPSGIVKLFRHYGVEKLCTFHYGSGEIFNGSFFEFTPTTEKEKNFFGDQKVYVNYHISLSCKDHI